MLNSEFVHCMRTAFNPFMPNGISHHYRLKQSISFFRDVRCVFFIFIQILIENYASKWWRPWSDTVLDCSVWSGSALFAYVPEKRTLGIYGLKMQLFCLSHKRCRNFGSILPSESALGKSDLSIYKYENTLNKTRKRETVSYNKTIGAFF